MSDQHGRLCANHTTFNTTTRIANDFPHRPIRTNLEILSPSLPRHIRSCGTKGLKVFPVFSTSKGVNVT
ncbi:hypothetical protein J6590_020416 [Homalodisca vitripennis]|nr:hypothetical protein J6590_020416 [Homalodisca vitripennis]